MNALLASGEDLLPAAMQASGLSWLARHSIHESKTGNPMTGNPNDRQQHQAQHPQAEYFIVESITQEKTFTKSQ